MSSNIKLTKTNSENEHFKALQALLDKQLAITDGDLHSYYHQFNANVYTKVILATIDDKPVGIGAIKEFSSGDKDGIEIKRMYVDPSARRKGVAQTVLKALEEWASELGYKGCLLETGDKQTDAIALYKKCNYEIIENYGQYIGLDTSVCMRKVLKGNIEKSE